MENRNPLDLRGALAVNPFLQLIPKQDIAPFIAPKSIVALADDPTIIFLPEHIYAQNVRDSINRDPSSYKQLISYITEDFKEFDDEDLDDLTFKKPRTSGHQERFGKALSLPPLESEIFESTSGVEESSFSNLEIRTDPSEFDGSRLSVRKKYNIVDQEATAIHNHKYKTKFFNECNVMGMDFFNRGPFSNQEVAFKRPLESSESDLLESKRIKKLSYVSNRNVLDRVITEFESIMDSIKSTKDDIVEATGYWVLLNDNKVLSTGCLITLHDQILKLVTNPTIENVPVPLLTTVQEECFSILKDANVVTWNEIEQKLGESQDSNINITETIITLQESFRLLIAAKTIMLILNGPITDKRLFLEKFLEAVIDLVYPIVQDTIIAASLKQIERPVLVSNFRPVFSVLVPEMGVLLKMVSIHISKYTVDDHLLTKLEYLSILIIFADNIRKDRSSYVGVNNFENLRNNACLVLVSIFKTLADQRSFILNEILSSFDKLPPQKATARQLKLSGGGSIQLVTSLLVQLVESFDPETILTGTIPDLDQFELDQKAKHSALKWCKSTISESSKTLQKSIEESNEIATFLISILSKNPDHHHKHSFELLLEDLLNIINLPEWAASELIVTAISKAMLITIQNQSCSSLVETYFLEMLGLVGQKILHLQNIKKCSFNVSSTSTQDDVSFLKTSFEDVLEYMKSISNRNKNLSSSLSFLSLEYICFLEPLFVQENPITGIGLSEDGTTTFNAAIPAIDICKNVADCILGGIVQFHNNPSHNSDHTSITTHTGILLFEGLSSLYDAIVNLVVKSLESTKIKTKTKAIKILSTLIEIDSDLLISSRVQDSISNRLLDGSPLVRDAVIDLISKYLNSKPEVIAGFYTPICECMGDDSVQVRKRVLKLAREMYLNIDSPKAKAVISGYMLQRLEDEDDVVQELATNQLAELWFTSKSVKPTDTTLSRAQILMDVVNCGSKTSHQFDSFIKTYIVKYSNSVEALKNLVSAVLDFAIDFAESKKEVERATKLISTLVKCESRLLSQDQLVILQPYLVDEGNYGTAQSFYCLEILNAVLPNIKSLRPDYLEFVQAHLLKQLTKYNTKELNEAMPCVWRLGEMKANTIKIANASVSCLKLIRPFLDEMKNGKSIRNEPKLQKLLNLLGSFGKFCKLEKHRDVFLKSTFGMKEKESVISVMVKYLLYFCDNNTSVKVRSVAIRNLISICSTHPKLFMSEPILKVLDREFASDNLPIIHNMVSGIMEFLQSEDKNSQMKDRVSKKSTDTKLDVAVFHGNSHSYVNDGICAGLVHRYIGRIAELCLIDSGVFTFVPVQFLQLVVKLGFANPKMCILTIIALESSTNYSIKNIARELHEELYEKHESLTNSSYIEGVKLAVEYRKNCGCTLDKETEFLDDIYSIFRNNYSSRMRFVHSLSKIVTIQPENGKFDESQRNMIEFTSVNLTNVKFSTLEEILIIVLDVDKFLARTAMDFLELIDSFEDISSNKDFVHYCMTSQMFSGIIALRDHLVRKYSLTRDRIESFRPRKVDLELKQAPKSHCDIPFTFVKLDGNIDQDPGYYTNTITAFRIAMQEFD